MTVESASIAAIVIGAVAVLSTLIYALVRGLRVGSRIDRISRSPAVVAVAKLPAEADRISASVQRLQEVGDRWDSLFESLTATRDAGTRLQSGVDSVAACIIDLLDTLVPSMRGSAL